MKTIGLLGGMSWESTAVYYRLINQEVRSRCGGLHSARCILDSVNFSEIAALQRIGDWKALTEILSTSARGLKQAGADFLVICTNTMHYIGDEVARLAGIPLLHIADATGQSVRDHGMKKVGLLGTKFTMEMDFYKERLANQFGLEVIVPEVSGRNFVHNTIFEELCCGRVTTKSKNEFLRIMDDLQYRGAEGIVLGCTEIPLLVGDKDTSIRLFDTTYIHAIAAVKTAFGQNIDFSNAKLPSRIDALSTWTTFGSV